MTSPRDGPIPEDERLHAAEPPRPRQDGPEPGLRSEQEELVLRYHVRQMKRFPVAKAGWTIFGIYLTLGMLALSYFGGPFGFDAFVLYYAWILFMFLHYRFLRQNELIYLLAGAAEAQQPLPSVLRAYLADRPRGAWRSWMEFVLLSAVFPGYWFYHRMHSYDRKVYQLGCLLEAGLPLSAALKEVKGVASRETVLAASVGEKTGRLAQTLGKIPRWRLTTIWLDLLPRLLYPLLLLLTSIGVVTYLMIFIVPKFEKIFKDFRIKLPYFTQLFIDISRSVIHNWPVVFLVSLGLVALVVLVMFHSTTTWYFPIVRRFYRPIVQSRVLKMLGLLLQTGQPVPQALGVLIDSDYFRGVVRRRLEAVRDHVEQGMDLAHELQDSGLMPDTMIPLVRSAAKGNNLPWALEELGEHRARQAVAAAQRFTMALFPFAVLFSALIIGFIVLSIFSPLIGLIESFDAMK
jgi:type IV pilus assembly protein PilC